MLIRIYIFLLFLLAPILGIFLFFGQNNPYSSLESGSLVEGHMEILEHNEMIRSNLFVKRELITETQLLSHVSNEILGFMQENANEELLDYLEQQEKLNLIVEASARHQQKSADLIDSLLATMLGDPIGQTFGENSIVKVYSLQEAGYRGYMAKVRLHNPNAIKMLLANDEIASNGETTSQAAKRSGAVLAINAGGFTSQNGKLYPIGITVIDGEIVTFYDTSISFIGFNKKGHLVGGNVNSREQIKEMEVQQGASFHPILLKQGVKQNIPARWANTRHPRTLIGHFTNGDLFFMVVDGRREGWSTGVTLEEAQDKLIEFNIRDAYNLDGGGSSTFYYDGKVLNKPSAGQERRVTTNIVVMP
ncbi:phosphodiester glycosidase family protein [Anaerobacillus isosaccharinicus]|uniref:Phosphodiester glycosidase family protein n=1 Tax=Anaerobacillus isosaccharinicus TaxID=1532552 RepID=A0A1S2MD10_9BACI|nr:phosphodiester glycosidase family protein [Anaerobacillus isosaccharinicus]MBA5586688.1 phosphodiester glycosidase family protein [Anaerobacillus isosaccharinicus]QOY35082.1 phosphodiester glycosidase family protein [Anaerobacillus isosaccharinicus]